MLANADTTTRGALRAQLVVLAKIRAVAYPTPLAPLVVLAKSRAAACPTRMALLVVFAQRRAAACPTRMALLVVLAKSRSATRPTQRALLPMWTFLAKAPLHRVWRWWRHVCRSFHARITL